MAESLIEQSLRRASRPCHVLLLGDIDQAAQWKHFAVRKRNQLLATGRDMPMSQVLQPDENTTIRILTGPVVDIVRIEVGGGGGIILQANVGGPIYTPGSYFEKLILNEQRPSGRKAKFKHPDPKEPVGGNLDWRTPDKKTTISWDGPFGRSITPPVQMDVFSNEYVGGSRYSAVLVRGVLDSSTPQKMFPTQSTEDFQHFYRIYRRFSSYIYKDRKIAAVAPNHGVYNFPYSILGAAVIRYTGNGVSKKFLVAAMALTGGSPLLPHEIYAIDVAHHPEYIDHAFAWAEMKDTVITSDDWTIFHTEALSRDPTLIPTTGAYFFSVSGKKFASLVPRVAGAECRFAGSDDSSIVRGTLVADANGVSMASITVTQQNASGSFTFNGDYVLEYPPTANHPNGSETYYFIKGSNDRSGSVTSAAIVAIDFIGEQEVTLTGNLSQSETLQESLDVSYDEYGAGYSKVETAATSLHLTASVTDTRRSIQVGMASVNVARSDGLVRVWGGGSVNYDEVIKYTKSVNINIKRPAYYDLRTGAAFYTKMTWTQSDSSTNHVFLISDFPRWVYQYDASMASSALYTYSIEDKEGIEKKWKIELPVTNNYTDSGTLNDVEGNDVGFHSPINDGGKYLQFSASSTNVSPYTYGRYNADYAQSPSYFPGTFIGISDGDTGDVIGYYGGLKAILPIEVSWVGRTPRGIGEEKMVFATGFDIDEAWQNHLAANHPTAAVYPASQSELYPLFKF